ncbi:MAG: hypothetical protein FWC40_09540, partial [Proteobacteria bacterium]|nr:hypothetical protein [Pseudomonadota bacterium]
GEVSRHLRESGHWRDLVELLSNHWDGVEDVTKRCAMILEAAQIEAFRLHNVDEAIGLFERCMLEGMPGHVFDDLHKIVFGLMEEATDNQKLRVLVILTTHIVSYAQCDKVTKLQAQFDTSKDSLVRCLSMLVDAGVESFRGDQPRALELVREALVLCPDNRLADGILLRIVPKLNAFSEFSEVMNDLESESISAEDLSGVWLRIAKVLLRVPNRESEALDYAERAVLTNENNDEGVALCLSIAQRIKCLDRAFVYASLAAAREKQDKARSDMEALCADLKLALGDDEDALVSVYESFLQFTDLREEVSDGLCELISGMSDDKAIALLQRVEARCVTNGMADLVSGLYESVLEREISQSLKKGLLERYIGFLMGQGSAISRDVFLSALAQLYALSPTERLFGMLKTFVGDNTDEVLLWAGYLEDDLDMADTGQLARIYTTLADCYQNILKDYEKAAAAFGKLLEVAPDNVAAFKCCFASYERLERYFECTELCQKFPLDRLTSAERVAYCQKSLIYALIYLYNAQVMAYFLEALCREGVELIPGVVEFMVEKAHQASVGNDQLVCFFEAIEAGAEGVLLLALRVARAGCLVREGRGEDALAVLDASTAALVKAHRGVFDYSQSIRALVEQLKGVPGESEALKLWSEAGADVVPPLTPPRGLSLDAIVERCAENPDDEGCANAVDDALKSLSPDEATSLCIRLGALYEQHQRLAAAEGYYKRAFGYTQSFELLEFYKRQRQFRKALKIMQFKLAKSVSSEVKVAVKLDMVLAYEQLRDVGNALKNLDELLEEGREAFEKSVWVALLRRRGALLTSSGDLPGAIEALKQASAQADAKAREEIDVDTCFLMREEKLLVEAKKLWQTLVLRGVKGDRMQLLNACYDVDAEKYADAEAKLVRLLEGVRGTPMEVLVLEQQLRLEQAQGADVEACRATARRILDLDSANALAKAVLS